VQPSGLVIYGVSALRGGGAERAIHLRNALDGAMADTDFVSHLQDACTCPQFVLDALFKLIAFRGRPRTLPASTARLRPAWTRWRIMLSSNSAKAPQT
jgi:hypothetical protein